MNDFNMNKMTCYLVCFTKFVIENLTSIIETYVEDKIGTENESLKEESMITERVFDQNQGIIVVSFFAMITIESIRFDFVIP